MQISECGTWHVGIDDSGRHLYIKSTDFTHDVRLYVDGDFDSRAQHEAYAAEIARRLNSCIPMVAA